MPFTDINSAIDFYIDNTSFNLLGVKSNKAPITRNGVKDATRSKEELHALAAVNKHMNLATEVGERSGVIVVDCDMPKPGNEQGITGEEALKQHFKDRFYFDFDNHLWARTASGGMHMYFKYDPAYSTSTKIGVLERVDLKANGYVILEPSKVLYPYGKIGHYKFNDVTKPISHLLPWVKELIQMPSSSQSDSGVDYAEAISGIPEGRREQSIFSLAWKLRKQGITQDIATSFITLVAANAKPPFCTLAAQSKIKRAYAIKFPFEQSGDNK